MKKYRLVEKISENGKPKYAVQQYFFFAGWKLLPLARPYYAWFDDIKDALYLFNMMGTKEEKPKYKILEEK